MFRGIARVQTAPMRRNTEGSTAITVLTRKAVRAPSGGGGGGGCRRFQPGSTDGTDCMDTVRWGAARPLKENGIPIAGH